MRPSFDNPKLTLAFFLLLCYFPLFLHLDSLSLQLWDEGRRAVNALEMTQNGNILIPHYNGEADMWGTKPPVLVWLQAACMSMLGYTELAVRLPSALAGLATVLLLVWFCRRYVGETALGYFSGLVLLTLPGYLTQAHSVRSGDYDALLTWWLTGGLLFFYAFIEVAEAQDRRRYLWLTTVFFTLAVWTKGVAGLFFLPGVLLFALGKGRLRTILGRRETYAAAAVFVVFGVGYYVLREHFNPGYLRAIGENELAGRYIEGREGYHYDFWYYIRNLWQERLGGWVYVIPVGIGMGWWAGGRLRELTLLLTGNAFILLLVISNSKTKMGWYDLPVYPSLALLGAIPVAVLYSVLVKGTTLFGGWRKPVLTGLFVLLVFGYPYKRILDDVYLPDKKAHHQWEKMQYGYFMKNHPDLRRYDIGVDEYNAHVDFYVKAFRSRGYDVRVNKLKAPLAAGEKVLVCDQRFKDSLQVLQAGNLIPLRYMGSCILYEIPR